MPGNDVASLGYTTDQTAARLRSEMDMHMHEVLVQNLGLQLADAQRGQTPVFDNNIVSEEAWEVTASALGDHFDGPEHAAWRAEQREKVGLPTTKVKLRNGDTICTKGITSTRCKTHRKTNNMLRDADKVDLTGGGQNTVVRKA